MTLSQPTNVPENDNISKKLVKITKDTFDFGILFIRVFHELLIWTIQKLLPIDLKDVSKDIVLITGTGHGIGRELALQYAELGSKVICIDINEKSNKETVDKVNSIRKGSAYFYICDVTNRDAVLQLADKIKNEVGYVTILINNAGIMPSHPINQHTEKEIRKVFEINILSHFWTVEAFFPHFIQAGRGHLVSMSSLAGLVGLSNLVPYCATKFAVRGMMEALSEEIREGPLKGKINFTTICPYMTNTGLCKKPKVKFPSILGLLDPKEVASAVIYSQRANKVEVTIPSGLHPFSNFCRVIPLKCSILLKDFIDSGVESDLS
ncbi:short-chain dehydrogenase/reductase family 16C member 6 [Condylostylus longicornis]|uniref:short-chain dehydrogenase/reductase family 16C member 6 n=1 Tax=Condylostylus longicornis TaxID=2530218 RepID=UPI00244E2F49|nr:short-chain dehydrogenase/reductase family 16C member 6 [Condylostylus longicornis]